MKYYTGKIKFTKINKPITKAIEYCKMYRKLGHSPIRILEIPKIKI